MYVFDLDDTIALAGHRFHLMGDRKAEDWRRYFAACGLDKPNWPIIQLMHTLVNAGQRVEIWSARMAIDDVEGTTKRWLSKYHVPYDKLRLRQEGDLRSAVELKNEWTDEYEASRHYYLYPPIVMFFDDRLKNCNALRDRGYTVMHVADSDYE